MKKKLIYLRVSLDKEKDLKRKKIEKMEEMKKIEKMEKMVVVGEN